MIATSVLATSAQASQPLFDAHLHYNAEDAAHYAPEAIIARLRVNNILAATVTSRRPEQVLQPPTRVGLLLFGFGDLGQHAPHDRTAHSTRWLFPVVQIDVVGDLQPDDVCVFLDANGTESLGVGETGAKQQLHKCGVVRCDLIERLAGERRRVGVELVWREAADDHAPLADTELFGARCDI